MKNVVHISIKQPISNVFIISHFYVIDIYVLYFFDFSTDLNTDEK